MEALIPFAIKADTGEYVSVDHVESGEQCGCICPGCNAPLTARKGQIKQHHFGHMPRSINPDQPCPITFTRSLLWMCDAIIKRSHQLALPGLIYAIDTPGGRQTITATKESSVSYTYKRGNWIDNDSSVEVVIEVGGIPISLILSLGKSCPPTTPDNARAIVYLNLSDAALAIRKAKFGYDEILNTALIQSVKDKTWISHPRLYKYVKARYEEIETQLVRELDRKEVEKKRRHTERLNRDEQETQRVETMVRIARKIARSGDMGRQCMKCYIMTPFKAQFRKCPYCGHMGFGNVNLSPDYLDKAKHMYLSFGYGLKSLKYSVLTAE